MNIKRNLKGVAGVCLVVMLLISSFSITVSAQGGDPAPHIVDTRALNEIVWDIDNITPWILDYCDETAPAYSAFLEARKTAWDIRENSKEATQQQIDEATESLRSAYLALEGTLSCEEEQALSLNRNLSMAQTYIEHDIFRGLPLPNDITAESYTRMGEVRDYISRLSTRPPVPEELLGAVRMLQEAIAAIEINNADYTVLRAVWQEQYDVKEVSWQYTKNSYGRYIETCHICYREFECIPTQEETDKLVARIQAAKNALVLKGDNDQDGKISIGDVTNIQKDMARIEILEGDAYDAADVNCDGEINMQDVILSQKYIAKTIDRFPDNSAA